MNWPDSFINKIICGDCLAVMRKIPNESIDLIIIDPPFSSGARTDVGKAIRKGMIRNVAWKENWFSHDNLNTHGFLFLMRLVFVEFHRILKNGHHIYSFIDWRQLSNLMGIVESVALRQNNLIVWDKNQFGMGYGYRNQHELIIFASKDKPVETNSHRIANIIKVNRAKNNYHPTEKPVRLKEIFIKQSSIAGEVVLDCFLGSGTTVVACKNLDRNFIGIEINPDYCKIARERLAQGVL